MDERIYDAYEKLFMLDGDKALSEAIRFILGNKLARTQSDIAKKTGVSSSTLTAYLKGHKPISKTFIGKFNTVFDIDLLNPHTYEDRSFFDTLKNANLPPIQAESFIITFRMQRRVIHSQQIVIEGLKKTNEGLQKMMVELYDIIARHEKEYIIGMMTRKEK